MEAVNRNISWLFCFSGRACTLLHISCTLYKKAMKMLSLFTTLGVYRLLKKGTKPNTILLGIIVVSVLLTAIGVF